MFIYSPWERASASPLIHSCCHLVVATPSSSIQSVEVCLHWLVHVLVRSCCCPCIVGSTKVPREHGAGYPLHQEPGDSNHVLSRCRADGFELLCHNGTEILTTVTDTSTRRPPAIPAPPPSLYFTLSFFLSQRILLAFSV